MVSPFTSHCFGNPFLHLSSSKMSICVSSTFDWWIYTSKLSSSPSFMSMTMILLGSLPLMSTNRILVDPMARKCPHTSSVSTSFEVLMYFSAWIFSESRASQTHTCRVCKLGVCTLGITLLKQICHFNTVTLLFQIQTFSMIPHKSITLS